MLSQVDCSVLILILRPNRMLWHQIDEIFPVFNLEVTSAETNDLLGQNIVALRECSTVLGSRKEEPNNPALQIPQNV